MSSKGRKIAKNLGKSLRKKFDSDSQTDDLHQVGKPIPWHVKNSQIRGFDISLMYPNILCVFMFVSWSVNGFDLGSCQSSAFALCE